MALRKIPGVRHVRAKEVRELLKLPWVRDEELSDRRWDIRLLPDGRVLWYLGDHTSGTLYPSRAAFAEMKQACEAVAAKPPVDLARTLLPPIDDFLRDVGAHAKSLGQAIRVPDEALDRSEESLDVAYKAVLRLRKVKRTTPEIFTPLTAYVGEVMRLICDGRWTKAPTTKKQRVPVYDPEARAAYEAAWRAAHPIPDADADKATADVEAPKEWPLPGARAMAALEHAYAIAPKPIRFDVIEVPITGHENEPMIRARDGELFQPYGIVLVQIMEHGARGSVRGAVAGTLARYLVAKRAASISTTGSPTHSPD